MADKSFADALNEQIGNEFTASQQYVAAAVYYESESLFNLATFFYRQAVEERNHAMIMVKHLLDTDQQVHIPAIEAPDLSFSDIVGPVSMALDQEKRVTQEINDLFKLARENDDFQGEQFLSWFVKEQVEEVSSMQDLLKIVERGKESPLIADEYLASQTPGDGGDDPLAPEAAGGAL